MPLAERLAPRGLAGRITLLVALSAAAGMWACASAPRREAARERRASAAPAPRPASAPVAAPATEPEGPAPLTDPSEAGREVVIGAGGDVLLHLKVVRSAQEHADAGGFQHVFGELREVIGAEEIAFVNLETPLSERVPPETGDPPVLGAPAEVAAALGASGVDVASVANNHAYDQTARGLEDTLRALRDASVLAVGAASSAADAPGPVIVERAGVRVAFLAFTERINRGPAVRTHEAYVARFDRAAASAALALARAQADVVVVSIHWSHDFVARPLLAQRALARWLVEGGADVIVGHGPHVLQEVERLPSPRGDAVCAYSLGNLVSNQGLRYQLGRRIPLGVHPAVFTPETRDGAWLRVRVRRLGEEVRVEAVEAVPLWTHNNYLRAAGGEEPRLDIRVRSLRAEEPMLRAERRPLIERALGSLVRLVDG